MGSPVHALDESVVHKECICAEPDSSVIVHSGIEVEAGRRRHATLGNVPIPDVNHSIERRNWDSLVAVFIDGPGHIGIHAQQRVVGKRHLGLSSRTRNCVGVRAQFVLGRRVAKFNSWVKAARDNVRRRVFLVCRKESRVGLVGNVR